MSLLLLQRGVWLGVVRQRGGRLIADGVAGGDVGGYLQLAFALGGGERGTGWSLVSFGLIW